MISRYFLFSLLSFSSAAMAADSIYCPENQGYINVGMSQQEVISACGEPQSKTQSKQPVLQKIPQQQLIYNGMDSPRVFYGVWSITTGDSTGARLQVNLVNDKVESISLNGSATNAADICNGQDIQVGSPADDVYSACGSPTIVNNSFVTKAIPSDKPPEVWTYQPSQFSPSFSLTFVNGQLESIQ